MAPTEQDLARRAVERGLISQEQLDDCLAERRRLRKEGLEVGLRELLQERGLVDGPRWDALAADGAPAPPRPPDHAPTRSDVIDLPGAAASAPPQEVLGGYRIVAELGRGAMGVVYEAIQERLGRRVALKVLPQAHALQGVARERFVREAQATASLKHPGIVPIYDVGEERGVHFFAMELLEGRSLKTILDQEKALAPERAARIIKDAGEALDFAHERGVIHRDVKPDNIFVRQDGTVVVTDFGLALRVHDAALTREGMIVGTPLYMAPEQARGDAPVDRRADVYGLGITLYELLAGQVPFEDARDTAALLEMVTRDDPPPLGRVKRGLPAPLTAIVEVAMEKDPARRYPTAGQLAQDLGRFLQGEPILARPPTRLTRTWRVVRRRGRALLLLGAVLGVVAALGVSLHVLRRRWQADNQVLDAIGLARAGQRDAALVALERALELWPGLPEANFRLGELAATRAEARRAWDLALARAPRHVEALLARGRLSREEGDHAAALADFLAGAAHAGAADPRPPLLVGLTQLALGRPDDAGPRLRHGLELARAARATRDALYAEAVLRLGELELAGGDAHAALVELEEAVRLLPQEVAPQVLLAQALVARGDDPAAIEALSAALRRAPSDLRAQELRGRAYRRLGRPVEAFRDLTAARDLPSARLARGLLRFETIDFITSGEGVAFDDLGAREDLEAAAAEAARLSPRDRALALLALGWLELASPRPLRARAVERWQEAAALAPAAAGPRLARALVLLERGGDVDEAAATFEQALATPAGAYAARVGLARVAEARGDLDRARALLDEAVALAPARESAWGYRYRLRLRAGDPKAAEDRERAIARREQAESEPLVQLTLDLDPLALAEHLARRGYAAFVDSVRDDGRAPQQWAFHLARASALLGRALLLDPWSLPATARRASVLYLLGEFEAAHAAYDRAHVVDPALHEAQVLRAVLQRDVLEDAGPAVAELTLRRAAAAPGVERSVLAAVEYELARALVAQGRQEEALEALERASALSPRRHCVASLRARLLRRLGRPVDEAIERACTLFAEGERDRARGLLYARAGQRLQNMERTRLAEHFLTRAIEADPQNALAWRQRANVRLNGPATELPSAFIDTFVSAELDPRYSERFLEVETRLHRFTTFLGVIETRIDEVLVDQPDLPASYFFKGYVTFHQQRPEEAEGWFGRSYDLSRRRSYVSLAYRGAARLRMGQLEDAEADLDEADRLYPGGPVTVFWRACLRARQGDDAGALLLLEEAAARGLNFSEQIKAAPELERLRRDPRLRRLMRG
ncbi:MAG: protein kinase [Planctomycetes bacterium]|nr:protein kinase [Planctomycetota bacterium]